MSQLNFKNPIVLVPTIVIGVGLGVGALAYGFNSFFSGSSSSNTPSSISSITNYSTSPSPVVNNSPKVSYDTASSDETNIKNNDTTNSSELPYSTGGSRKKKKRRSKSKSKSKTKPKSKSR
jgi:hypothetical protein